MIVGEHQHPSQVTVQDFVSIHRPSLARGGRTGERESLTDLRHYPARERPVVDRGIWGRTLVALFGTLIRHDQLPAP
jgi:hypothetical protein